MNVETILRAKGNSVETIPPDASISSAVARLSEKRIGALVVSEDGSSVAGIISERDIVWALAQYGPALLAMRVGQLMIRNVITCEPEDRIDAVMETMTERRFRHLPVLRDGRLCGIVSIGDVVKSRLDEVEYEAISLRTFIVGAPL